MTTHYIDLEVVPDAETAVPHLLGALYDKLHLALVREQIDGIGVSFPRYSTRPRTLGPVLRLHGAAVLLQQIMAIGWLKGLQDHVRATPVAEVPPTTLHRVVKRKQFKTNVDRLRRRRMRRKGETEQQAAAAIPESVTRHPDLPYVHLHSRSTGQPFCLFIDLGPLAQEATPGRFNSHGLGATTTVPWF